MLPFRFPAIILYSYLMFFSGSTVSLGAGVLFGGLAGLGAYKSSVNPGDHWLTLGEMFSITAFVYCDLLLKLHINLSSCQRTALDASCWMIRPLFIAITTSYLEESAPA